VLVGIDAVSVMAAYQPVVQACGEQHRLIYNIDCVYTDEHRKPYFVVLAKHRPAP
jgi:hypothetical protein